MSLTQTRAYRLGAFLGLYGSINGLAYVRYGAKGLITSVLLTLLFLTLSVITQSWHAHHGNVPTPHWWGILSFIEMGLMLAGVSFLGFMWLQIFGWLGFAVFLVLFGIGHVRARRQRLGLA